MIAKRITSRSVLRREALQKGEPMPTFEVCPTCDGRGFACYGEHDGRCDDMDCKPCPTCRPARERK